MDYKALKSRIQGLVDDPLGSYTDDGFLLPLVNQKYDELYNELRLSGFQFDEQVVELVNVAAQTQDLTAYATTGKPLEFLLQPRVLEWKPTGIDATNYSDVPVTDRLRDVQASQLIQAYEWRNNNIYLTPCTVAADIRVRGEFLFSAISKDEDQVLIAKNVGVCLAYWTASLIGKVRGNKDWAAEYKEDGDNAFDAITMAMTRADQGKVRRVGRMSRRAAPRNITNFR